MRFTLICRSILWYSKIAKVKIQWQYFFFIGKRNADILRSVFQAKFHLVMFFCFQPILWNRCANCRPCGWSNICFSSGYVLEDMSITCLYIDLLLKHVFNIMMLRSIGVGSIRNLFFWCSLEIIKHLTLYSYRLFWIVMFVFWFEVGPCALDYTKMKTTDHFWTDPPADELVQRHRIHSSTNHLTGPGSPKRPGLQVKLSVNKMSCDLKMILLIGFLKTDQVLLWNLCHALCFSRWQIFRCATQARAARRVLRVSISLPGITWSRSIRTLRQLFSTAKIMS